jgi:hypothetical protein
MPSGLARRGDRITLDKKTTVSRGKGLSGLRQMLLNDLYPANILY